MDSTGETILNPLNTKSLIEFLDSKNLFWCNVCKRTINKFFAFMHEAPGNGDRFTPLSRNPFRAKPHDGTPDGVSERIRRDWNPKILRNQEVKPDGSTER